MKKIIFICLFVGTILGVSLISCKKQEIITSDGKSNITDIMSAPIVTTNQEIESQMQWIARGYPDVINTSGVLSEIKNNLLNKEDHEDLHSILQTELSVSISIDLEASVYSKNLINFGTPNSYDRNFFYDYEFYGCIFTTGLRIVDTIDNSLPWIVTYETFDLSNTFWGYFINNGSGQLDSIILDSSNYENYLVFVVYSETNCGNSFASYSQKHNDGCSEPNGVCEKLRGETIENCQDCSDVLTGIPGTGQHVLKIVRARVEEDLRTFDEAWIETKYEIAWDYWIADGFTGKIHLQRTGDMGEPMPFNTWKRKEVPIQRRNKLKGSVTEKGCITDNNNDMFMQFDPSLQDIYVRFWDSDKRGSIFGSLNIVDWFGHNTITFPSGFSSTSDLDSKGGSFYHGGNILLDGVLIIPAGSTWSSETIAGDACHSIIATTPNGEITVKLATVD